MTWFILSHPKLAFPHILQLQLCIKIPRRLFWAQAAVVKEPGDLGPVLLEILIASVLHKDE